MAEAEAITDLPRPVIVRQDARIRSVAPGSRQADGVGQFGPAAAKDAADQRGQRFGRDDTDVALSLQALPQAALDPLDCFGERFTLGQADGFGRLLPLLEDFGVFPPHVVDLQALPQPVVHVAKIGQFLEGGSALLADGERRRTRRLAGGGINDVQPHAVELADDKLDLFLAASAQRQVERTLDAVLLVEVGASRADQDHVWHTVLCD